MSDRDVCKAASMIWEALDGKPASNLLVNVAAKQLFGLAGDENLEAGFSKV